MAETPPDDFPAWATSGGADKAKPSDIQYARGFQLDDTTDFNSDLNYVTNLVSDWATFNAKVHAAELALRNVEWGTVNNPFTDGNSAQAVHLRYDDLADKWYVVTADNTTGASIQCYESSDDGLTWSAKKEVITDDANDESCTPLWSNGTKCAMAATEHSGPTGYMWISTDETVANLAKMSGSFNNIVYVKDFLWDTESGRWYCTGTNAGNTQSYIESSGDDGANWTLEYTCFDNISAFDTDQVFGNSIAVCSDSTSYYSATKMDGAWAAGGTVPSSTNRQVHYLDHLDMFVILGPSASMYLLHQNDLGSGNAIDSDYDFDMCAFTDDLVIFEGDTGTRSELYHWYSMYYGGTESDTYIVEDLGGLAVQTSHDWDENCTFRGGNGRLMWLHQPNDRLAIAHYGAKE